MTNILIADFIILLLVFMRIVGMIFSAPIFAHNSVPILAKIFLALIIAYITFLTINKTSINVDLNLVSLVVYSIRELITGLIIGYVINFIFWGVSYAGTYIGFDMGLMLAEVMNPMEEIQNNIIGEILYYTTILVFLLINGHHYVISGVVASFNVIPIGKYVINSAVYLLLIKYSFVVFIVAIKIASPIIVSFFLIHIAESIIARVIPQIQIIFVSQPLKSGIGILLLTTLIPFYIYAIRNLLERYETNLLQLIRAMGS
ncbi:flagellar biosynthetic protein FliR [Rosettibacter firmus]|uniref:flagellar biosynthetic protein FliR n=1 Tax=Rosettibacter firmus TaxID=3111522 RepID=UPI00336C2835